MGRREFTAALGGAGAAGDADETNGRLMTRSSTRRSLMLSAAAIPLLVGAGAWSIGLGSLMPDPAASQPARPDQDGKRVTLLYFTDIHAHLESHPEYVPGASPEIQIMGGFARLKTAIERERANCDGACFLLDGGDEFQGTGPATWSEGEVVLDPLNALGSDAFVPGNWEAAYGPERFKQTMARLSCPVICYNLHDEASGERVFRPSLILERDGVKVAFVGITDIGASRRQPPTHFRGMDTARVQGLRDFVKELRARERPDLVVAVSHTGLTISRQTAREIPEFDVILSAHTHERTTREIMEGNVIVVEPGCFGSFLGRVDLVLKPGGVASHTFRLIPVLASRYEEDPKMKALVDKSLAPHRSRMAEPAGTTETLLMRYDVLETTADAFITDAVREIANADIGFSNGFRFGVPIPPATITEADLWSLLPMDARMKSGWITGQQLMAYLERELELVYSKDPWKLNGGWGVRASGMTMVFKASAEPGRRLVSVKVNGRDVEDRQRYTIAGCEREGEPLDMICRHPGTHDAKVLPLSVHQALREYLKAHPAIAPRRDKREIAIDLPAIVFSQDAALAGGDLSKAPTTPSGLPAG
jgi:2',3'-cyclic-nucleotide 2'-phosphodiesterase (5'-nucleotidase family)